MKAKEYVNKLDGKDAEGLREELEALRSENAQMRSDGQAAIDAISAENANLRSQLSEAAKAPAAAPPLPPPPLTRPPSTTCTAHRRLLPHTRLAATAISRDVKRGKG